MSMTIFFLARRSSFSVPCAFFFLVGSGTSSCSETDPKLRSPYESLVGVFLFLNLFRLVSGRSVMIDTCRRSKGFLPFIPKILLLGVGKFANFRINEFRRKKWFEDMDRNRQIGC